MIELILQNDEGLEKIPSENLLKIWIEAALQKQYDSLEQVIRVASKAEIKQLNKQYRAKDKTTNILSFPAEQFEFLEEESLGDLVVCNAVVIDEAKQQAKSLNDHWAHLIVHGMLHLQGYDHVDEVDAEEMEALEVDILKSLGISNPYNHE
ncbi:MAG: rRNA maturation RNase YbeY [Gammaproteobacteria bacterium]|nr:rRNA maturation RNase YbeY [Gammaproteobacteria bacterium]